MAGTITRASDLRAGDTIVANSGARIRIARITPESGDKVRIFTDRQREATMPAWAPVRVR